MTVAEEESKPTNQFNERTKIIMKQSIVKSYEELPLFLNAPAESTKSTTTSGRANTLPETPTASESPAMSTPKPVKNVKKNWLS